MLPERLLAWMVHRIDLRQYVGYRTDNSLPAPPKCTGITARVSWFNPKTPHVSFQRGAWTSITEIMTLRTIIRYPDPRLALAAQPVTVFDGALRELAKDLLETMHAAPGIGITAPHIGISLRVVVLDLDPIDGARTYVNPEIIWASPEMILHQEGSVSMPGVNEVITRHARVRISYQDVRGNWQTEESAGLRAVCHQHEIDQLNGLFWIKRLSRLKRERLIKRFEKVSRD
jgi:peptide deformylase